MAAYTHNSGGTVYFDALTGGSANATLDTHAISNNTTLVIRTDTYACSNHSTAVGSWDGCSFSGLSGELKFDPTYTRYIPYSSGTGNSPAYGATISQGGVSGVFLGCWADWQSEPVAAGAAIPASGFMKIGGIAGGAFASGALTGITATCDGADKQAWIEIRAPETGGFSMTRLSRWTSVEAWFELGTTNGTAGQILPCPTTGTFAGTFAGIEIETSAGSGVYELYDGMGTTAALSTIPTDGRGKVFWATTSGVRLGSDGTNNVGYLPPTGCKVRIPATLCTNCTRTAGGSGGRVVPNATYGTRFEILQSNGGDVDLKTVSSAWYMYFWGHTNVSLDSCHVNDHLYYRNTTGVGIINNCIVSPTQQQNGNAPFNMIGGQSTLTVTNSSFRRYTLTAGATVVGNLTTYSNVTITDCKFSICLNRTGVPGYTFQAVNVSNLEFIDNSCIGSALVFSTVSDANIVGLKFSDSFSGLTNTVSGIYAIWFTVYCIRCTVDGFSNYEGLANVHPYNSLIYVSDCNGLEVKNIGTFAAPYNFGTVNPCGNLVTWAGNQYNKNCSLKRIFTVNSRLETLSYAGNIIGTTYENVFADYTDTTYNPIGVNVVMKGCGMNPAIVAPFGANFGHHFHDNFSSLTTGYIDFLCNEPSAETASQVYISSGTPKIGGGSIYLLTVGDQFTFEMPYFALGHTAFANTAPVVGGTNVTYSSGSTWGNHTLEYQVDLGTGYNGTWLAYNATSLSSHTIDPAIGVRLKIRATCLTASLTNTLYIFRTYTVTTSSAQSTNLYPLTLAPIVLNNLISGTRVQVYNTTTSTELYNGITGTSLSISVPYTAPETIRVRTMYQSGVTAKKFEQFTETLTTSGFSRTISQVDDTVYNDNAINGSAVTGITIDDTNLLVNVNTGSVSWQSIYAYESYWLTTEVGIRDEGRIIEAVDPVNYKLYNFKIKNITSGPSVPVVLTGGYGVDAVTGLSLTLIDTTGGTLFSAPDHVVAVSSIDANTVQLSLNKIEKTTALIPALV